MRHIIALFLFVCAVSVQAETNSAATNRPAGVVLVSVSASCYCVLEKCKSMRNSILTIMTNGRYRGIKFSEIDYSTDQQNGAEALNKYGIGFIPGIAVFLGNDVLYKDSYNFDTDKFITALDFVSAGTNTPKKEQKK